MADMRVAGIPFWGVAQETWETVNIGGHEIPGICRVNGTGFKLKASTKKVAGQDGASVVMLGRDLASFNITVKMWEEIHLEEFRRIIEIARPRKEAIKGKAPRQVETLDDSYSRHVVDNYGTSSNDPEVSFFSYDRSSSDKKNLLKGLAGYSPSTTVEFRAETLGYQYLPLKISHPALDLFGIREATIQSITIPQEEQPGLWTSQIACTEFDRARARVITRPKSARGDVSLMDRVEGSVPDSPSRLNGGVNPSFRK